MKKRNLILAAAKIARLTGGFTGSTKDGGARSLSPEFSRLANG